MKRIDMAIAVGLIFSILVGSFSGFAQECDSVRSDVLRLHILANSDSGEDQALKLAVRDAVLEDSASMLDGSYSKEEAKLALTEKLDEIEAIAADEIARQGYDYSVTARVVNRFFDTRVYEDFTLPAGRYDAVQLEIGAGNGRNWWCVMFPPMCLPAAEDHDDTELEQRILELGSPSQYKPAFAVVEAVESIREMIDQ